MSNIPLYGRLRLAGAHRDLRPWRMISKIVLKFSRKKNNRELLARGAVVFDYPQEWADL